MGAYKNDQVTMLNIKPEFTIIKLNRIIELLKVEIAILKEQINILNNGK